jgi:predicted glycoside hydrolase/deacetylase ChbG (UPF0249 family)
MATQRYLIVNADDFGLSPGVNRGIIQAHEEGIVTSASLMVRWPAAAAAAASAREHPCLSVGLHVDLGEWICRGGAWECVYEVVSLKDPDAVAREVARQLDAFRALVGRGPSHLDSHQHVHLREPARSVVVERARGLGVPVRHYSPGVHYCGEFYGQTADGSPLPEALSVANLTRILAALPPGLTELACHPGAGDVPGTMYQAERAREVEVLCDPRAREAIEALGIGLRSFGDVADHLGRIG